MVRPVGFRLPETEERLLALVEGLAGVLFPFGVRGGDAVVLRDEFFVRGPGGGRGGVPVCDPADVGLVCEGERDVALVVGLWGSACCGDDSALAGAAAWAGH